MAQVSKSFFNAHQVRQEDTQADYARRMGDVRVRISEALRIDEVPKPVLLAILVLMLISVCIGLFLFWRGSAGSFFIETSEAEIMTSSVQAQASVTEGAAVVEEAVPVYYYVYVAGCVQNPDVYELEEGSRVRDAIEAAGGLTEDADLTLVNLAALVSDSEKIYIPAQGEELPADSSSLSSDSSLVNLNTAGAAELQTLTGIGEALAAAIISDREKNGPFTSVEDLTRVSGIGDKTLERFSDRVCV